MRNKKQKLLCNQTHLGPHFYGRVYVFNVKWEEYRRMKTAYICYLEKKWCNRKKRNYYYYEREREYTTYSIIICMNRNPGFRGLRHLEGREREEAGTGVGKGGIRILTKSRHHHAPKREDARGSMCLGHLPQNALKKGWSRCRFYVVVVLMSLLSWFWCPCFRSCCSSFSCLCRWCPCCRRCS